MTRKELETIDIRADREILSLICCEVFLRKLMHKRVTKALKKRQEECIRRFLSHFEGEETICVHFSFNHNSDGSPDMDNLCLTSDVFTNTEMRERIRMRRFEEYDDDEYDDE